MGLEKKARQLAERTPVWPPSEGDDENDWWLSDLGRLYRSIGSWLSPLEAKGLVRISERPKGVSNEHPGAHDANTLVLRFASRTILLVPQEALVFGGRGRVDVYRRGSRGMSPAMLILSGPSGATVWSIWPSVDPMSRTELDKQSFEALLESLL